MSGNQRPTNPKSISSSHPSAYQRLNPPRSSSSSQQTQTHVYSKQLSEGDYEILNEIARGGFAIVHRAKRISNQKLCAIKILKRRDQSSGLDRDMKIWKEIEVMMILEDKFEWIITLLGWYVCKGSAEVHLVLELAEGGDLFDKIELEGPLSEGEARVYTHQVSMALEYLHRKSIIYRDLKSTNVLLTADHTHIRLADFGLAKRTEKGEAYTKCGTRYAMAPEMIIGASAYTKSVDWYGLGVLLYEMVTGTEPFVEACDSSLEHKILYAEVKFPSTVTVSSPCKELIRSLLSKSASRRPKCLNDVLKFEFMKGS